MRALEALMWALALGTQGFWGVSCCCGMVRTSLFGSWCCHLCYLLHWAGSMKQRDKGRNGSCGCTERSDGVRNSGERCFPAPHRPGYTTPWDALRDATAFSFITEAASGIFLLPVIWEHLYYDCFLYLFFGIKYFYVSWKSNLCLG